METKKRLAILGTYLLLCYLLNTWVTGTWQPLSGDPGLWFLSVIAFLSFALLSAPIFIKPDDSLAASIASLILLWSTAVPSDAPGQHGLSTLRWIGIGYALTTGAIAAVAAFTRRKSDNPTIARTAFRLAGTLGIPSALFTIPVLLGAVAFFQDDPIKMLVLVVAWVLIISLRPIEMVWDTFLFVVGSLHDRGVDVVGRIHRIDSPNIIRVNINQPSKWESSGVLCVRLVDGSYRWLLPLFTQVQEGNLVGTGLCVGDAERAGLDINPGFASELRDPPDRRELIRSVTSTEIEADLIGFVVEESQISQIKFEIAGDQILSEGSLVFCRQADTTVYYQIADARTAEESFERNPRGTHIVTATQLGVPSQDRGFTRFSWLPKMNTPVFMALGHSSLEETKDDDQAGFSLGIVPGTDIKIRGNIDKLREYHCALLGVTGTGKTELAFDIIREAYRDGCKIICVDFTGEYCTRLENLEPQILGLPPEKVEEFTDIVERIETGDYKSEGEKKELKSFLENVRPDVDAQVDEFLSSENASLGLFELPEIVNTRTTLRATELYLSTIFKWARENRRARKILVVLEEAHTVIPEMNLFGYDKGDTFVVVGRLSQIALQGRKYGVGLLLVSQRTALVSKTVLSQCNTVISFSLVDKTSLDYLGNVFSSEHVRMIPNLPNLHAVAHGIGIKSERPIMVEIPYDQAKLEASRKLDQVIPGSGGTEQHDTAGSEDEEPEAEYPQSEDYDADLPF